ncbi:hypothetical protein IF2G_05247 [Cordyceps javanica]|nr:hypothetical protein IF2G_05247 [Cordyceps javanica]
MVASWVMVGGDGFLDTTTDNVLADYKLSCIHMRRRKSTFSLGAQGQGPGANKERGIHGKTWSLQNSIPALFWHLGSFEGRRKAAMRACVLGVCAFSTAGSVGWPLLVSTRLFSEIGTWLVNRENSRALLGRVHITHRNPSDGVPLAPQGGGLVSVLGSLLQPHLQPRPQPQAA